MYVIRLVTSSHLLQVLCGACRCYSKVWYSGLCCLRGQCQSSLFPCVFVATSSNEFCCCFAPCNDWPCWSCRSYSLLFLAAWWACWLCSSEVTGNVDHRMGCRVLQIRSAKGCDCILHITAGISTFPGPPTSLETHSRETSLSLPSEILRREAGSSPSHVPYSVALHNLYSIF